MCCASGWAPARVSTSPRPRTFAKNQDQHVLRQISGLLPFLVNKKTYSCDFVGRSATDSGIGLPFAKIMSERNHHLSGRFLGGIAREASILQHCDPKNAIIVTN